MPSAARGAKICNRLRKQPQGKARRRALCRSESGFNPWWRRKAEGRGLKKKPHVKKQKQAAGTLQRGERWELGEGRIIREGLFPSMTEMFKHRVKMPPNSRRLKIPNGRIQTQVSRGVGQGSPNRDPIQGTLEGWAWRKERRVLNWHRTMVTAPPSPPSPLGHSIYRFRSMPILRDW